MDEYAGTFDFEFLVKISNFRVIEKCKRLWEKEIKKPDAEKSIEELMA